MYPGKYPPYDDGLKDDIFIRNATGGLLIGVVLLLLFVVIIFSCPKVK